MGLSGPLARGQRKTTTLMPLPGSREHQVPLSVSGSLRKGPPDEAEPLGQMHMLVGTADSMSGDLLFLIPGLEGSLY